MIVFIDIMRSVLNVELSGQSESITKALEDYCDKLQEKINNSEILYKKHPIYRYEADFPRHLATDEVIKLNYKNDFLRNVDNKCSSYQSGIETSAIDHVAIKDILQHYRPVANSTHGIPLGNNTNISSNNNDVNDWLVKPLVDNRNHTAIDLLNKLDDFLLQELKLSKKRNDVIQSAPNVIVEEFSRLLQFGYNEVQVEEPVIPPVVVSTTEDKKYRIDKRDTTVTVDNDGTSEIICVVRRNGKVFNRRKRRSKLEIELSKLRDIRNIEKKRKHSELGTTEGTGVVEDDGEEDEDERDTTSNNEGEDSEVEGNVLKTEEVVSKRPVVVHKSQRKGVEDTLSTVTVAASSPSVVLKSTEESMSKKKTKLSPVNKVEEIHTGMLSFAVVTEKSRDVLRYEDVMKNEALTSAWLKFITAGPDVDVSTLPPANHRL